MFEDPNLCGNLKKFTRPCYVDILESNYDSRSFVNRSAVLCIITLLLGVFILGSFITFEFTLNRRLVYGVSSRYSGVNSYSVRLRLVILLMIA